MLTAVHIINRLLVPILDQKTPFEKLYGKPPSFDRLKVFGCLCFASTLTRNRSKFDLRSSSCVFLGYPFGVKGYKLLDLTTKRIFVSRDVHFLETVFPFISPPQSLSPHTNVPLSHLFPSVAQPPAYFFDFPTSAGPSGSPVSASPNHLSDNPSNGNVISPLDDFPTENSTDSAELLADISADTIPS